MANLSDAHNYINNNLLANANVLIYKLSKTIEHLPEEEQEALYDLQTDYEDYETPAKAAGWERIEDAHFFNEASASYSRADTWEDLCSEQGIDPDYIQYYEYWVVSPSMCWDLQKHGEKVVEFMGLFVWARGCTGQAVYYDEVIRQIVAGKQ